MNPHSAGHRPSSPVVFSDQKIRYHAELLANRVKKRFSHLSKKFKRRNIDCFRLYDWDIPEVRAVVDWYAGHLVVGEYERKQTGPDWLPAMAEAAARALDIPLDKTHIKRRHTKTDQGLRYQKMGTKNARFTVSEGDLRFWVNLDDFLDTGLYSDHRETRIMIRGLAAGKDFLNLFAYTGAFTCAAALGGAKTTTSVDRSDTYIKWARDNLELNGLSGPQHLLIQSAVDKFLTTALKEGRRFSLAFIDPPSFFQDQNASISFDVSRDHPTLLQKVLKLMLPGSIVLFSTNHQRFEPHFKSLPVRDLQEITAATVPEDYRNKTIHRCWRMIAL